MVIIVHVLDEYGRGSGCSCNADVQLSCDGIAFAIDCSTLSQLGIPSVTITHLFLIASLPSIFNYFPDKPYQKCVKLMICICYERHLSLLATILAVYMLSFPD